VKKTKMIDDIVGKSHTFEDGDSITVTQIKIRDGGIPWVTYQIQQGPGIPRRLVMSLIEFTSTYGHLFGISEDNLPDFPD
jgi:hypothetical protein